VEEEEAANVAAVEVPAVEAGAAAVEAPAVTAGVAVMALVAQLGFPSHSVAGSEVQAGFSIHSVVMAVAGLAVTLAGVAALRAAGGGGRRQRGR